MSIQLSSTELVSRIIADPTFANEIINYVTIIKPKLATLAKKTHVLEQIESAHEEKIQEYKKLLKKLHGKYEKLGAELNKKQNQVSSNHQTCEECVVKAQTIEKLKKDLAETKECDQVKQELASCKVCETKDKLIGNLEAQVSQLTTQAQVQTCKSCEEKNGFIKDLTGQIGQISQTTKPCGSCARKDEIIEKITKTSAKQFKEKDSSIKRLGALVKQMEMESIEKDQQITDLNKLVRSELNKQEQIYESQLKQNLTQTTSVPAQSNPSVVNEIYRQFENFLNQTK